MIFHMLSVIADGGIILSRAVNDKQALPRQIMLYRDFIRAVFLGSLCLGSPLHIRDRPTRLPVLALFRHPTRTDECPLLVAKRT